MLLALCTMPLAACDAATEIAGDAIRTETRNTIVDQCQQMSENAGIAANRVASVCECTADAFLADESFSMADIDPSRLEGLVNTCTAQTG